MSSGPARPDFGCAGDELEQPQVLDAMAIAMPTQIIDSWSPMATFGQPTVLLGEVAAAKMAQLSCRLVSNWRHAHAENREMLGRSSSSDGNEWKTRKSPLGCSGSKSAHERQARRSPLWLQ